MGAPEHVAQCVPRFCDHDMRPTRDLKPGKRCRSRRALAPVSSHPRQIGRRRAKDAASVHAA
ncbi:hypothetical protein GFL21_32355 [Rhizobium anhuiense]|nr:hypothetical protein [Rhizobium anhuiense]